MTRSARQALALSLDLAGFVVPPRSSGLSTAAVVRARAIVSVGSRPQNIRVRERRVMRARVQLI